MMTVKELELRVVALEQGQDRLLAAMDKMADILNTQCGVTEKLLMRIIELENNQPLPFLISKGKH